MRRLILIALLITASLANAGEQVISVQHDSSRSVTCWITPQGGISCLPDNQLGPLLQAPTSSTTDEDQTARASLTTSMCQSEQLPTSPHLQEKRFKL